MDELQFEKKYEGYIELEIMLYPFWKRQDKSRKIFNRSLAEEFHLRLWLGNSPALVSKPVVPWIQWLKQEKCIVSQFWKLEVWGQGISMAMNPLKVSGNDLFQGSLLASGGLLAIFGIHWFIDTSLCFLPSCTQSFSLCASVEISPIYNDTSWTVLRPTPL